MPWVMVFDRLGAQRYWAHLVGTWIGLSLNVALVRIFWAWAIKRSSRVSAA
jgi:hypothetical protein